MSKGYVDYVIANALHIDCEFKRDCDGIEWPIFKDDYLEWLADEQKSGVVKSSQPGYLSAITKLVEYI